MITTNPNALNVHTAKLVSICFVNISHYTCLPSVTLPTLLSFVCLLNFSPLRLSSILLFLTFALSCSLLQRCVFPFFGALFLALASYSLRICFVHLFHSNVRHISIIQNAQYSVHSLSVCSRTINSNDHCV